MKNHSKKIAKISITHVSATGHLQKSDRLVVEEPLELRIASAKNFTGDYTSIAVTMRTPGDDFELAAGFLFCEGVIQSEADIREIAWCVDPEEPQQFNIVNILLHEHVTFDLTKLSRNVYTTSSCGICGKASLELIWQACPRKPIGDFRLGDDSFHAIGKQLLAAQPVFAKTGGLHAVALFDSEANLLFSAEDVGRHNALDKLIGKLLLENKMPATNTILWLSGRVGFELAQKAALAGIPVIAAVGAPTSLAVDLAREYDITLVGFLRDDRFNIYTGKQRCVK